MPKWGRFVITKKKIEKFKNNSNGERKIETLIDLKKTRVCVCVCVSTNEKPTLQGTHL